MRQVSSTNRSCAAPAALGASGAADAGGAALSAGLALFYGDTASGGLVRRFPRHSLVPAVAISARSSTGDSRSRGSPTEARKARHVASTLHSQESAGVVFQVAVQKRGRCPLDDSQLGLLVGVGAKVGSAE